MRHTAAAIIVFAAIALVGEARVGLTGGPAADRVPIRRQAEPCGEAAAHPTAVALADQTAHQMAPAQAAPATWLARLSSWLEAVSGHRPGSLDMHARLVGFWTEYELYEVRSDFFALVAACRTSPGRQARRPASIVHKDEPLECDRVRQLLGLTEDEAARGNASRLLLRAAVFHTDVATLAVPFLPARIGCSSRPTLLLQDGNRVGSGCVGIHWAHARNLLDAVRTDKAASATASLWYHATLAYMLELGDYASASPHVDHAQLMFPDDPAVLFEHGLYHEGLASALVQPAAIASGVDTRGARVHLEEAADRYRRALEGNPRFVEARVHRGFALGELGRHKEAAEELRRAVDEAQGAQLRYYAELFLGRAEESMGNVSEARERYRRAADLYPQAQSPLLSLALLARQRGDRAGMAEAMSKVRAPASSSDPGQVDPWWRYYRWQSEGSGVLLAELYRRVRPEGPR